MNTRRSAAVSAAAPSALRGCIRALIEAARKRAASTVNSELTMLYWRIGQRIRTQVLDGRRGAYGKEVLPTLAAQLVKEYGGSFAEQNLRSEEHTSELQSLMRISYAVFCLQKKNRLTTHFL